LRWWIFGRVIDNFGDAGVCWRLARQLALEHDAEVILFIDQPALVSKLDPAPRLPARLALRPWPQDPDAGLADADGAGAPDVIVSAFGCDLPARARRMLAGGPRRPLWINLEYLSAEPWIDGCHGLASTKPSDGAIEHYFFPGFTPASGGLIRERDATAAGAPDESSQHEEFEQLYRFGLLPGERLISLFCYPDAPLARWLPALALSTQPTLLVAPEGVAPGAIEAFAGPMATARPVAIPGSRLRVARVPFVPQHGYDQLLRLCDFNFVRGEDSWIRAHWAGKPFIWQPYPQPGGTHLDKLDAFLERFAATADTPALASAASAVAAMMRAWSGDGDPALAWQVLERSGPPVDRVFGLWVGSLLSQRDLAERLVSWARSRL
jgi:uncharacterized repeat protein (TIGR03837 family)